MIAVPGRLMFDHCQERRVLVRVKRPPLALARGTTDCKLSNSNWWRRLDEEPLPEILVEATQYVYLRMSYRYTEQALAGRP